MIFLSRVLKSILCLDVAILSEGLLDVELVVRSDLLPHGVHRQILTKHLCIHYKYHLQQIECRLVLSFVVLEKGLF